MEEIEKVSEGFSLTKRAKSVTHATRGLGLFLRDTHNAWVHASILSLALIAGAYFRISHTDWMLLILSAGLVFMAEAFNTAIEVDINLTSPEYHPYARDTKDIAAGAVLIAAITAAIVGIGIFGRYIIALF